MFDTEKFICEIEQRPAIYNVTLKEYSNKLIKAKCWNDVGEAMYENWSCLASEEKDQKGRELMKKWKALRDNFMKEQRLLKKTETGEAAAKKKKYVYFDQLLFLLPYVKGNDNTVSNIPPPVEEIGSSSEQPEADHNAQTRERGTDNESVRNRELSLRKGEVKGRRGTNMFFEETSKTLTSIMAESVQLQREERNSDKYGNKAFMLSFVPIMDTLPQHLQIQTRMEITNVFNAISYRMTSANPSPCPSTLVCSTPSPAPPEYVPQSSQNIPAETHEMDTHSSE